MCKYCKAYLEMKEKEKKKEIKRKIWLISDLHINHMNIIKYTDRPFSSVKEMNDTLIRNWNSIVDDNDTIYVLGDFCLGRKENLLEVTKKLKGHKILLRGNHDRASTQAYLDAGFEQVFKKPFFLVDEDEHIKYLLSHHPIDCAPPIVNIHGHIHNKKIEELDYPFAHPENNFNVSADVLNFTPILFDDVKKKFD